MESLLQRFDALAERCAANVAMADELKAAADQIESGALTAEQLYLSRPALVWLLRRAEVDLRARKARGRMRVDG